MNKVIQIATSQNNTFVLTEDGEVLQLRWHSDGDHEWKDITPDKGQPVLCKITIEEIKDGMKLYREDQCIEVVRSLPWGVRVKALNGVFFHIYYDDLEEWRQIK